jgi:hypothetical protein
MESPDPPQAVALAGASHAGDAGTADAEPSLSLIADYVRDGNCILFLGSGIHSGPPADSPYTYARERRPVQGGELCRHLAAKSGFASVTELKRHENDLQKVSLYYEMKVGFRKPLVDEIRKYVHADKEPSPVLHWLARLDFPLVITTNYDQLFERALEAAGKAPRKSIYDREGKKRTVDCERDLDPGRPFILKVHGDVDVDDSIVVTDEDYTRFIMRMAQKEHLRPVPPNVSYFLDKKPILFIGYSLFDYNLRLFFRTLRWEKTPAQVQPAYAVELKPDYFIRTVLEDNRLIRFIVTNLWDFVPRLYREVTGEEVPA